MFFYKNNYKKWDKKSKKKKFVQNIEISLFATFYYKKKTISIEKEKRYKLYYIQQFW